MPDSSTMPAVESEALDEVELEELNEAETGAFRAPGCAPLVAGPRSSMPPPIPAAARQSRAPAPPIGSRPSSPAGAAHPFSLLAPPPPARISVPPSVPAPARVSVPPAVPPPQSGTFRIENVRRPSSAPPIPAAAAPAPDVQALKTELQEQRNQVQRLRLQLRMRDDRLQELERLLAEAHASLQALERRLEQQRSNAPDDLKRIRGIGPAFERRLREAGVASFAQIAAWRPEDVERMAQTLSIVPQRIVRDGWIERARELAG